MNISKIHATSWKNKDLHGMVTFTDTHDVEHTLPWTCWSDGFVDVSGEDFTTVTIFHDDSEGFVLGSWDPNTGWKIDTSLFLSEDDLDSLEEKIQTFTEHLLEKARKAADEAFQATIEATIDKHGEEKA